MYEKQIFIVHCCIITSRFYVINNLTLQTDSTLLRFFYPLDVALKTPTVQIPPLFQSQQDPMFPAQVNNNYWHKNQSPIIVCYK